MSPRAIIIKAVLLVLLLAPGARADGSDAGQVLTNNSKAITIEREKSILIRLDRPAKDVFIANPEIADVQVRSPRIVYIFGRVPGETTLYALDADEDVIFNTDIHVTQNLGRMSGALQDLLPEARIRVEAINGMLLVTGFVASPDEADTAMRMVRQSAGEEAEIINRLQITTPTQIHLRVKIAEVSRDVVKTLGFNWESVFDNGDVLFGIASGADVFRIVEDEATGLPIKEFLVRNGGTDSLIGNISGSNFDLNTVIDALETEGFLSVLAEPNLTALSGETASFLAGGEFPVPVPDEGDIALEFKEFGVGLTFLPTVISEDRINLQVAPEVSQLTNAGAIRVNNISVPSISTRRASTTVELASGQSFAIAGLLQNNLTQDQRKLPGLGDIPILGALFRSDSYRRQETELLIIVTPYIVRPVDTQRIALPTDAYQAPDDLGRYFNEETGRFEDRPTQPAGANPVAVPRAGFKIGN